MKKKPYCRIISAFLAVLMLITAVPLNAFATTVDSTYEASNSTEDTPDNSEDTTLPEGSAENTLTYQKWDGETVAAELSGDGSAESPYTIASGAELMYFAAQVNTGNTYEGMHILLTENIDMDMFQNGKTWTPIGVSKFVPFMGTFDGGCHEIINLNITNDSDKLADSEVYYIGFFGYVKGASVEDFGIYNYKLNQTYNYDTEIGAMIAHAENSTVTNCYANGDISAIFEDTNPLNRGDVITLTSVPTELNYTNEHGQGVILDLRNASSLVNTTMTIKGDVSALRLIGNPDVVYEKFNIVIGDHANFDFYLDLRDFNMRGNSSSDIISIKFISYSFGKCSS